MSFGREFGRQSDFRDSWASPFSEWSFPQFADDESGGGSPNFYHEILGENPDEATESQPNDETEASLEEELQEPTMTYTQAMEQARALEKQIKQHLGEEE